MQLEELKKSQYLTKRIFHKISENMHYEIFKYIDNKELLVIRSLKLGGYQLTSNKLLRSRIKNYFPQTNIRITIDTTIIDKAIQRLKHLFEQTNNNFIHFHESKTLKFDNLSKIFKVLNYINGINMCNN